MSEEIAFEQSIYDNDDDNYDDDYDDADRQWNNWL